MVEALYFRHTIKYINNTYAKQPSYYRIQASGKITCISMAKRTVGSPKTLSIQTPLEPITEQEWNDIYKQIIGDI